jgi:hypothetical protein
MTEAKKQFKICLRYDDRDKNYYLYEVGEDVFVLIREHVMMLLTLNESSRKKMINENEQMTLIVEVESVEDAIYQALTEEEDWKVFEDYYKVIEIIREEEKLWEKN